MALTSTLYTGLSGLNVNQTRMNVIGNNIANVNTVAFKASRCLFKPQFYVTDADGTTHDVPFHRVKDVYRNGELIWHRDH